MTEAELLERIEQAAKEGATELDLSGNQLTALPPEIGKLTRLKKLILGKYRYDEEGDIVDIIRNELSALPTEIGLLNQLEELQIVGNRLKSLPLEIVQLINLQTLDLSSNQLSALPPEIIQLTNLQSLNLSSNELSALPSEIRQLTNLQSLELHGNQLSALPPEIVQLTNLQSLNLSSNELSALPPEVVQFTNLQSLNLGNNELSALPSEIGQLTNLQSLELHGNQLSALPPEIGQLTNLQSLNLNLNQLSALPLEIVQLTNLQSLSFGSNELSFLPPQIVQLTNLQSLYMGANVLSALPPKIAQLTNLQTLDLRVNQLSILPPEIVQLTNLHTLVLWNNQLSALPPEIVQLTNLHTLNLTNNQLSALPPEIGQLTNLQTLSLSGNQLSALPPEIGQLTNLQLLNLRSNQLSALPLEIGQLTNLHTLGLSNNQLSALPPGIGQLTKLKKLDLRRNPVPIPPEILGSKRLHQDPGDVNEILDFYFRIQDPNDTEPLYEAKFLIVGEGGAGKTSLAKKIKDESYKLQSDEESTEGIDVIQWGFTHNGNDFRVNIWDFGGQEIYHQTHQFFLTERSLYALVADTRKENTDFYWWLKVVELLSDNSPVLIIKNEKQDRLCEVNERQLRGEFKNLKEALATNLANNRGLPEIKDAIEQYITRLPHVGTLLPKLWVRVRSALENYSRNYISFEEYCQLCKLNNLADRKDMLRLSRYLHDLGVCLHFQDDSTLKNWVILKPEWGTTAVYKVLDNDTVKKNLGCFTQDELKDIWNDNEYADMRDELLQLMMRFKLCYPIPNRSSNYIAPQLLDINQPEYTWDENNNLILRYKYEFMPKGILTRFIVETHPWIEQQNLVWRSGVVLNKDQSRAEVIEHYNQKEIKICVAGNRKKELLGVVTHELEKIHRSFERLQYETLVPCNCKKCEGSQSPHAYPLNKLREFLEAHAYQISCMNSYQMVDVRRLIDDVNLQATLLQQELEQERKASLMPESITRKSVFISYSHKDKKWFDDLKTHLVPLVREQNLQIWDDTKIKPGDIWRDEIATALASAKVALLLVSPHFLASDFISKNELPPLLEAAKAGGVRILWIPLRSSNYTATAIEQYQAAHSPAQPLNVIAAARRDKAWVKICETIKAAANL